nr:hypothetical protein [uncultured Roseateles sp.]
MTYITKGGAAARVDPEGWWALALVRGRVLGTIEFLLRGQGSPTVAQLPVEDFTTAGLIKVANVNWHEFPRSGAQILAASRSGQHKDGAYVVVAADGYTREAKAEPDKAPDRCRVDVRQVAERFTFDAGRPSDTTLRSFRPGEAASRPEQPSAMGRVREFAPGQRQLYC